MKPVFDQIRSLTRTDFKNQVGLVDLDKVWVQLYDHVDEQIILQVKNQTLIQAWTWKHIK